MFVFAGNLALMGRPKAIRANTDFSSSGRASNDIARPIHAKAVALQSFGVQSDFMQSQRC
jgi:hypothetical protein